VVIGPLAHAASGGLDDAVATVLFIGAGVLGWKAASVAGGQREEATGRFRVAPNWPRGILLGGLAVASLVLGLLAPGWIRQAPSKIRPSTNAALRILSPEPGQVFRGNPASVPLRLSLAGGRLTSASSTKLQPDEGHLHVYLDGQLLSMTNGLRQVFEVAPGRHRVMVEFVALDHGPFKPRVVAAAAFEVRGAP
jgi:hypothetical protein